jgi:isohexenylglutaconyl-CoA hydratase
LGQHLCATTADINRTQKAVLDDILKLEPQALATVKRLVLACSTADDRTVLDDAARSLVDLLRRPQASEGIRHFMAKTSPPWAKR